MSSWLALLVIMGYVVLVSPYTTIQNHTTVVNRVPSLPTPIPSLLVSLTPDLLDDGDHEDGGDSFHAARMATPIAKTKPNQPLSPVQEMATGPHPSKFPDSNTSPSSSVPSTPDNNKLLGAIIGASTGGVVVLGAVALFVWNTYHHRDVDRALPVMAEYGVAHHTIPKFPEPPYPSAHLPELETSSAGSNSDADDGDMDDRSARSWSLNMEEEAQEVQENGPSSTNQQHRLSTIIEEREHCKPSLATEDDHTAANFQVSTLEGLNKMTEKLEDAGSSENITPLTILTKTINMRTISAAGFKNTSPIHDIPQSPDSDDIIELFDNSDTNVGSGNRREHTDTGIKTNDSMTYTTHKLLHYPPLVAREKDQDHYRRQRQQQQQITMATSSHDIPSYPTSAPDLTYPLRKIIHHPGHHPSPVEQLSHEDTSIISQREEHPTTPLGMAATEFIPLQNSPFSFVPRLSIMLDPEKRQGIHEIPKDTTK